MSRERRDKQRWCDDTALLMLAVMGCLIREMWPNATWMHQDHLEEVKIAVSQ